MWDKTTGELVRIFTGHRDVVYTVAVDGQYVYSGSADRTVRMWDKTTGELVRTFIIGERRFANKVTAVAVDDRYIYSGLWEGSIRVWDKNTGKFACIFSGHGARVYGVVVDGQYVYTCSRDWWVIVWNRDIEWRHGESGAFLGVIGVMNESRVGGVLIGTDTWPLLAQNIITFGLFRVDEAFYKNVQILNLIALEDVLVNANANKGNEETVEGGRCAVSDAASARLQWQQLYDWLWRWFCSETVLQQYGLIWCDWRQLYQAIVERPSAAAVGLIDLQLSGVEWAVFWTPYGLSQLSTTEEGRAIENEMLEKWRRQREQLAQLLGRELPPKVREAKSFRDLLDT